MADLTLEEADHVLAIAEHYATHERNMTWRKGHQPCMKLGAEDRQGFAAHCMRPAGHGGACDGDACMKRANPERDVVFLLRVVRRLMESPRG